MPNVVHPGLLVGLDTLDDAAVVRVSDHLAICFTADFITPVVDDPADWGHIAAANSLSDVYAMGGKPLAALNLVCWPDCLTPGLLAEVLAGGSRAVAESGCAVVGGHTIKGKEPTYGMAVIGTVHPHRILRNQGALPADLLYLSKPLGSGIIATAIKAELADRKEAEAATACMKTLNRAASEAAIAASARAVTDVTGFGLAGHLTEMLGPSGKLGVELSLEALPLLPGVRRHMEMGTIPGGAYRNRDAYSKQVRVGRSCPSNSEMLLYDPQTSGGLLVAVPSENAEHFEEEASHRGARINRIGIFNETGLINVVP